MYFSFLIKLNWKYDIKIINGSISSIPRGCVKKKIDNYGIYILTYIDLTTWHKNLTRWHKYLTSRHKNPTSQQIILQMMAEPCHHHMIFSGEQFSNWGLLAEVISTIDISAPSQTLYMNISASDVWWNNSIFKDTVIHTWTMKCIDYVELAHEITSKLLCDFKDAETVCKTTTFYNALNTIDPM